jgi:outer membrane protein assembly factor BamB
MLATPVVRSDRTVVYGSGTTVMAVSSETGAVVWKFRTGGLPLLTSPTLDDNGDVYITTNLPAQTVFALHGGSGTLKWKFVDGGSDSSCRTNVPLYWNGVVYWSCSHVYGFRADTGATLFAIPVTGDVSSGLAIGWDGVVFAASTTVVTARGSTGALLWAKNAPTNFYPFNALLSDGVVYAFGQGLLAYEAATGALLWQNDNPESCGGALGALPLLPTCCICAQCMWRVVP